MLCKVIPPVVFTSFPVDVKLPLFHSVSDPIKSHINCFGSSLFDLVIDYTFSAGIVSLNWGGRLWMSEEVKSVAEGAGILCIMEEGSNFSFCGGGHNIVENGADNVNSSIDWWQWGIGIS